ncbi:MAG: hypothetical protein ACK57A_18635, partial [Gemmatimonas sp.]
SNPRPRRLSRVLRTFLGAALVLVGSADSARAVEWQPVTLPDSLSLTERRLLGMPITVSSGLTLDSVAMRQLEEIGAIVRRHPSLHLKLRAYTDCEGSAEYLLALSQRLGQRARAVIARAGGDAARVQVAGMGCEFTPHDTARPTPRGPQRRIVIEIVRAPETQGERARAAMVDRPPRMSP